MNTAVALITHRFDGSILGEFHRMRQGLHNCDAPFIVSDGTAPSPDSVAPWVHTFDFDRISARASRVLGEGVLRNIHLVWIDFFETHPNFDEYWFIEYDVKFSAPWNELFDAFRGLPYDLLSTHVYPQDQDPGWYWWSEIQAPGGAPPTGGLLRGFMPIARLSRRGLERLRDAVDEGWTGFLEGLVPTLFQCSGLSIADIGGEGPFVPEGFRNLFYTNVSNADGSPLDLGTMRFRPSIPFPGILRSRLYHPVKPEDTILDATDQDVCSALASLKLALKTIEKEKHPRNAERQLNVATGLGSAELLGALEGMDAGDPEGLALRQQLQALHLGHSRFNPFLTLIRSFLPGRTPSKGQP